MATSDMKRGSTELLVLALVEDRPRHGYEIGKLIESRSAGELAFSIPALYPTLSRMEDRGWIEGRWVEKPGAKRRKYYSLTREGRKALVGQRRDWRAFVDAITHVAGLDHA
jgi:transcriptional regulator